MIWNRLAIFLQSLPDSVKEKYAPHAFDWLSLHNLLIEGSEYHAFLAYEQRKVIAYQVVKTGWLDFEWPRLSSYPVEWVYPQTATYAPVVDAAYQNRGISKALFSYLLRHLKKWGVDTLVLWGGVQSANQAALGFYQNLGFSELGHFEYHGDNLDMILKI
jgi:GNAT superfamily N-acetyltransferase